MKMPISDVKFDCMSYLVQQQMAGLEIDWMDPRVQACGHESYGELTAYTFQPHEAKQLGHRVRKRRRMILNFVDDLVIRETDGELVKRVYTEQEGTPVELNEYILVSEGQAPEVLQQYHDNQGHHGVNKTFDLVRHNYVGISLDMVKTYIHTCRGCNHVYVQPKPRNRYKKKKIKLEILGDGSVETDQVVDVWVEGQFEEMSDFIEAQTATDTISMESEYPSPQIRNRNLLPTEKSPGKRVVIVTKNSSTVQAYDAEPNMEAGDMADTLSETVSSSIGGRNGRPFVTIERRVPAVASDVTVQSVTRQPAPQRRKLVNVEHSYHTASQQRSTGQQESDEHRQDSLSDPDRDLMICLREQVPPSMKWTDFYGVDEAKQSLEEYVIWPKKYPHLLKDIKHNKGLLLHGRSGSGKTSLVQSLGGRSQCKLLAISSPLLVRSTAIDTMKTVQLLFSMAKQRARAIVFIDDLEKVLIPTNTSPQSPESGVLVMLEEQLENLIHMKDVYVICATTTLEGFNESLIKKLQLVEVALPNETARTCILEKWLTNASPYRDLVGNIVKHTEGFTGDNLADLAQEILMGHARNAILRQNASPDEILAKAITKIKN